VIDPLESPPEPRVFAEPWHAQVFALALTLHAQGVFTWREWADTLARCIAEAQAAGDPDDGSTYYQHWLGALEDLVAAKGIGRADELEQCARAWARAAARTPHGQPIELRADDRTAAP
jgi:nitrile hydratase accessory protein